MFLGDRFYVVVHACRRLFAFSRSKTRYGTEIGCFNERNYTPYNSPPLSTHTHTTAPKARGPQIERGQKRGGEGEGKGAKGELLDNTRLVRTSLCTWILIGLRDYWSK